MTAVGTIDHVPQPTPGQIGIRNPPSNGAPIDTQHPGDTSPPKVSEQELPPGSSAVDNRLAFAALQAISHYVGVDYARIAALMLLLDSELARAARDARVMEIDALANQMHAIADKIRTAAKLALAGGVVSGGLQVVSAGINIAGGFYGIRLTSGQPTTTAGSTPPPASQNAQPPPTPPPSAPPPSAPPPSAPPASPGPNAPAPGAHTRQVPTQPASGRASTPESTSGQPVSSDTPDTPAAVESPDSQPGMDSPEMQAASDAPEPQTPEINQPPGGGPDTPAGQDAQDVGNPHSAADADPQVSANVLDHTLSQQLSAKAQSSVLVSQGLALIPSSAGELSRTVLDYTSRLEEADIKDDEAEAEEQRAHMENTRAFGESMQKSAHDMIQVIQQMYEGMNQTSRNIWSKV